MQRIHSWRLGLAALAVSVSISLSHLPSAYADTDSPTVMETAGAETQSADPHPATLRSVSVDRKTAGVGDTVTVSWDVDDEEGLASVSPRFGRLDPSEGAGGSSTTTIGASSSSTPSSTGAVRNSSGFRVDSETEEGTWGLVELVVRDNAGYVTRFVDKAYAELYPTAPMATSSSTSRPRRSQSITQSPPIQLRRPPPSHSHSAATGLTRP